MKNKLDVYIKTEKKAEGYTLNCEPWLSIAGEGISQQGFFHFLLHFYSV